eukprot:5873995-Pyramimonas_sp.AAC.1
MQNFQKHFGLLRCDGAFDQMAALLMLAEEAVTAADGNVRDAIALTRTAFLDTIGEHIGELEPKAGGVGDNTHYMDKAPPPAKRNWRAFSTYVTDVFSNKVAASLRKQVVQIEEAWRWSMQDPSVVPGALLDLKPLWARMSLGILGAPWGRVV